MAWVDVRFSCRRRPPAKCGSCLPSCVFCLSWSGPSWPRLTSQVARISGEHRNPIWLLRCREEAALWRPLRLSNQGNPYVTPSFPSPVNAARKLDIDLSLRSRLRARALAGLACVSTVAVYASGTPTTAGATPVLRAASLNLNLQARYRVGCPTGRNM